VAAVVVDNLGVIARFSARPNGEIGMAGIRTSDPARDFTVRLSTDTAWSSSPARAGRTPIWCCPPSRLVYGRLDPEHTPAFTGDASSLDTLRAVFLGP
jgi:hypothetical protein